MSAYVGSLPHSNYNRNSLTVHWLVLLVCVCNNFRALEKLSTKANLHILLVAIFSYYVYFTRNTTVGTLSARFDV